MRDLVRFSELLKRDLLPLLYGQGFRASAGVFRRLKDERIDIVSLQGSRAGRRCYLDLGVHYSFLPPAGRAPGATYGRELRQHDCAFRERLHEPGEADHWWDYGADDATAEANAAGLVDIYRRRACLFFARFEPFPEVFYDVTPEQVAAGDLAAIPPCPSRLHAALTLARIMKHTGRLDRCRDFAEAGLRHPSPASWTRRELERLKDLA